MKSNPETICTSLFSEYPSLKDLLRKQLRGHTRRLLILSRSWVVDIGLQKKQDVVCNAHLVVDSECPVLFTVVRNASCVTSGNWKETAHALKQKLVSDGGYISRVYMIVINGEATQSDSTSLYPKNCILTSKDIATLLQAPVTVILSCEIFNLLTLKQHELNINNLHKIRKQFALGLPGTGKTIAAFKIIEIIKNTFCCSAKEEILSYFCENQPLRGFVG
uniref:Schlafen GTPase-like domain-containing protein n=1 Tax=Cyanoderma ruficeps TaxID=181631 RepID=A0A8C3QVT5_9PASS